jgi:transcriptional regulator with XRE-family HTH domain
MEDHGMQHEERQAELVNFLRTRRARLSPEHVGLPNGTRRRTPGLRREEVAQLANVSVEWYTRLEQGRDIHLSSKTLENIAHALLLDENERLHLFHLVGQEPPPNPHVAEEEVSPSLQRYLDALGSNPAYVLSKRWDRLAWNAAACALFEDFSVLSTRERNVVWSLFVNPARRRLHVDWEVVTQRVLAEFRVSYGRYADDPLMREMVEDLQRLSPEFRLWWPRHMVQGSPDGIKLMDHPLVGRMALEYHSFLTNGTLTQRVVVYTPLPQDDTLRKLEQLLAHQCQSQREVETSQA